MSEVNTPADASTAATISRTSPRDIIPIPSLNASFSPFTSSK